MGNRLLLVVVPTRSGCDLSRPDLQVRDQIICGAEGKTLTGYVFPNVEAEIRRGEVEVFADRRLIDPQHSLWDWRKQGVS